MRKIFNIIGICGLTCFSFFYTDKMISLSRENDPIMKEIYKQAESYHVKPCNALVGEGTIKSGLSGKKVDALESYNNMKRLGEFNENLLVFVPDLDYLSIDNYYDKFIVGSNSSRKEVALVFTVSSDKYLNEVLDVLKTSSVVGNFFVDGKWAYDNYDKFEALTKGNYIGNLGYDGKYSLSGIKYVNSMFKVEVNYDIKYCYSKDYDYDALKLCGGEKMHTINPVEVRDSYVYSTLKNAKSGEIFHIPLSSNALYELPTGISYLKQKGFSIVSLEKLLSEK